MAIRLLPPLRELPHDTDGHGELWRLIPGAGLTTTVGRGLGGFSAGCSSGAQLALTTVGRGLGGFFRRTEGE